MMKSTLLKRSKALHQSLIWIALFAFLAFILSALTHPIMVWTGPQAESFRPPSMKLNGEEIQKIPKLMRDFNILEAAVIKVLPSATGNMLQITPKDAKASARQYINLSNGQIIENYDQQQAIWLARHYTGISESESGIKNVEFITEFTADYPWVNRLIPVYKISFDNDEALSAYVYTETNALASLNNNWKQSLQTIFQTFHTWAWLDGYPLLRISIILLLLTNFLMMLISGLILLIKIKRKKYQSLSQRFHRGLAWVVWLPLMGFTLSGIYHLLQNEFVDDSRGMRLGTALAANEQWHAGNIEEELQALNDKDLNSFSVIRHQLEQQVHYFYRASLSNKQASEAFKPHAHHAANTENEKRKKRFNGINRESAAVYIPIHSVSEEKTSITLNDKQYSQALALNYLGLDIEDFQGDIEVEKITRFGADYDFRNKRLPVYKVSIDNDAGDRVFIDPVTGIVVDHLVDIQRYEGLSFSMLHKWNFMMAFADRQQRDITIVIFLACMLLLTFLGLFLELQRRKKVSSQH